MTVHVKLPLRITLVAYLVLIIAALNAVRVITVFAWDATLETYHVRPGMVYIAATGVVWATVGAAVVWGIWRRKHWTLMATVIGAFSYAAWAWIDRLALQSSPGANWEFSLLATVLLLGGVAAVALDPRNQAYFTKRGV